MDIRTFFKNQNGPKPAAAAKKAGQQETEDDAFGKKRKREDQKEKVTNDNAQECDRPSAPVKVTEDTGKKRIQMEAAPEAGKEDKRPVLFSMVASTFEEIDQTTKRLEIQKLLSDAFTSVLQVEPESLRYAVDLCCCQVAPAFHGIEMGVGDGLLKKIMIKVTGKSRNAVDSLYKEAGDLGSVAQTSKSSQSTLFGVKAKALLLKDVHAQLARVATTGKADDKQKIIEKMFVAASGQEAKYLVRCLQGKLRIGLAEQTVLIALAHALCEYHYEEHKKLAKAAGREVGWHCTSELKEKAVNTLKQVYSELPIYSEIIDTATKEPALDVMWFDKLRENCSIRAGVPLKPMLAKPTNGISQVLDRFQEVAFTCEYKYDGERAQIHMTTDDRTGAPTFKIYSRNSEDNTSKYPDIRKVMPCTLSMAAGGESRVTSFIMDSEAVAYDLQKKKLLPFQKLSTRARKDVEEEDIKVQVIVCAFDLLFLNGESLLERPLAERRELLHDYFRPVEDRFCFAVSRDGTSTEDIEAFLNKAVEDSCEGLMVKTLYGEDSYYQPSRRSLNWLKLKKDYLNNLADSLDLVPIGAYYGKGKRTGTFGAYILASYDEEDEEFQSITKIGTGFSDTTLEEFTTFFKEHVADKKPGNYRCDMAPDVWFNPVQVWEVRAADLSISPIHKAATGKVDESKGIALRFPRFLRIRDDKSCEDATNSEQVADMYLAQNLTTSTVDDELGDWV